MPLKTDWCPAEPEHVEAHVPEKSGIYELRVADETVYIGRTETLQTTLLAHLEGQDIDQYRVKKAGYFRSQQAMHRTHYDLFIDYNGHPPPWNDGRPS